MAKKGSEVQRTFHVSVVGLSGTEKDKGIIGVGKSCLCNRFVRPLADEYNTDHISVLSQSDFSGRVVNNDHFLYWGEVTKTSDEGLDLQFSVVEQTEFIDDSSFQPFKGGKTDPYVKRCSATKLTSAEKLMYICKNQLGIEKEYEQKVLSDGKINVDGFVCTFDVSAVQNRALERQVEMIGAILNNLLKTKKPVVLATTKNDEADEAYIKEAERLVGRKEFKGSVPLVETSAHENVNVELAFVLLAQMIDRTKGRSKVVPFVEASRARREVLDVATDAYLSLIRAQVIDYRAAWSLTAKKLALNQDFVHFCDLFGRDRAQREFKRHVRRLKEEFVQHKKQAYLSVLPEALQVLLADLTCIGDSDWMEVRCRLKEHPDFHQYFVECSETDTRWEDSELMDSTATYIPFDLLESVEAETCFRNHLNALRAKEKTQEMKKQFKSLLEEAGYVTPGKSLSDVKVLFMGRECFEALREEDCLEMYDLHQKEITERAKQNFQELLLEHADLFYQYTGTVPSNTITQEDIRDIVEVLQQDSRYKALDRLDQDRQLILFQHLGFVHCPIREHCPSYPSCMDMLIEKAVAGRVVVCRTSMSMSNTWHRSSSGGGQRILSSLDNGRLHLVLLGCGGIADTLASEIRAQCEDDEYELDDILYTLDYRVINGDVSLPQNAFHTPDFSAHGFNSKEPLKGCFCIYSDLEGFEYIRNSLEKALMSNLEEDRLSFQETPIIVLFAAAPNMSSKDLVYLRDEGHNLSESFQCPFWDVSDEGIGDDSSADSGDREVKVVGVDREAGEESEQSVGEVLGEEEQDEQQQPLPKEGHEMNGKRPTFSREQLMRALRSLVECSTIQHRPGTANTTLNIYQAHQQQQQQQLILQQQLKAKLDRENEDDEMDNHNEPLTYDCLKQQPDIRVIMCLLCGDPYAVEHVLGPVFGHQGSAVSGERSVIFETYLDECKRRVEVIMSSYHGANCFRDELVHGFILVYSTKRKASLATLRAFSQNIPNLPIQILAVTESGGANAFFSSNLSHSLITEGNSIADQLQAHFMTATTSGQQKTAFYTPFFKEVWDKKPEIEQAFHMEEPATPAGDAIEDPEALEKLPLSSPHRQNTYRPHGGSADGSADSESHYERVPTDGSLEEIDDRTSPTFVDDRDPPLSPSDDSDPYYNMYERENGEHLVKPSDIRNKRRNFPDARRSTAAEPTRRFRGFRSVPETFSFMAVGTEETLETSGGGGGETDLPTSATKVEGGVDDEKGDGGVGGSYATIHHVTMTATYSYMSGSLDHRPPSYRSLTRHLTHAAKTTFPLAAPNVPRAIKAGKSSGRRKMPLPIVGPLVPIAPLSLRIGPADEEDEEEEDDEEEEEEGEEDDDFRGGSRSHCAGRGRHYGPDREGFAVYPAPQTPPEPAPPDNPPRRLKKATTLPSSTYPAIDDVEDGGSTENVAQDTVGWFDDTFCHRSTHRDRYDTSAAFHSYTTGRRKLPPPTKPKPGKSQPGKLDLKNFGNVTNAIARMSLSSKDHSSTAPRLTKAGRLHAPLATPESMELGSEYAQVKDVVHKYALNDAEYAYATVQDALPGGRTHRMKLSRRDVGKALTDSDSEWSSLERHHHPRDLYTKGGRKTSAGGGGTGSGGGGGIIGGGGGGSGTHKKMRKRRGIPVATPRVPPLPYEGVISGIGDTRRELVTRYSVSKHDQLLPGFVGERMVSAHSLEPLEVGSGSPSDGSEGETVELYGKSVRPKHKIKRPLAGLSAAANVKKKMLPAPAFLGNNLQHQFGGQLTSDSDLFTPVSKFRMEQCEDDSSFEVPSPKESNSPITFGRMPWPKPADGEKTARRKDKQKSKEDEKQEKRRQKEEEKQKKEKEKLEKKKQKQKIAGSGGAGTGGVGTLRSGSLAQNSTHMLEEFAQSEDNPVPLFIEKCILFIEDEGLDSEGIYRVPGNRAHVELLFQRFDEDPNIAIQELDIPVNAVATALKDFFSKRLPPLMSQDMMQDLTDISNNQDRSCRLHSLQKLLKKLCLSSFEILKFVFAHFVRVAENCKLNSMDSKNLAICWWPTLLPIEFTDMGGFERMRPHLEDAVQNMIDQYRFLFCGQEEVVMV